MSNRRHQYIALITSLPHLGRLFSRKEVPISRYRLRQRMSMLEPGHARLLKAMVEVTAWAGVAKYSEDRRGHPAGARGNPDLKLNTRICSISSVPVAWKRAP
jgi:hypothetical protein